MDSKLSIASQELKCGITSVTLPGTKTMESMENCSNTNQRQEMASPSEERL